MSFQTIFQTKTYDGNGQRLCIWNLYQCNQCGGLVLAWANAVDHSIQQIIPEPKDVNEDLPERARHFLRQAMETINSPSASIMVAASAVDAMLKEKQLVKGSLNDRINQAVAQHLITPEMGSWAHDVRLDANDERHADEHAALSTVADAERAVDFAKALGQFLFVLPARVRRGMRSPAAAATSAALPSKP